MSRSFLVALTVSLLVGADDPNDELSRLQGGWRVVSVEHQGEPLPQAEEVRWVFTGDEFVVEVAGKSKLRGIIELGPTKAPKQIDRLVTIAFRRDFLRFAERGIYRLDDGTLTVCLGEVNQDRPAEFVSKPGSGATLIVLKREKN